MNLLPLAVADMNAVIGVVAVIVWIVVQVLNKKAGGTNPPSRPMTPAAGDSTNPQDELKKFFSDLEQGLAGRGGEEVDEEQEAAPPPPPVHRRVPVPAPAPHAFPTRQQRPVLRPPVAVPVQTSVPRRRPEPVAQDVLRRPPAAPPPFDTRRLASLTADPSERHAVPAQYKEVVAQMRNPLALRQMVIASEILSRPVGFRDRPASPNA